MLRYFSIAVLIVLVVLLLTLPATPFDWIRTGVLALACVIIGLLVTAGPRPILHIGDIYVPGETDDDDGDDFDDDDDDDFADDDVDAELEAAIDDFVSSVRQITRKEAPQPVDTNAVPAADAGPDFAAMTDEEYQRRIDNFFNRPPACGPDCFLCRAVGWGT